MAYNTNPLNLVSSADVLQDRIKRDIDTKLAILQPNRTGVYALLSAFGKKESVKNFKFEWHNDKIFPYSTTATAAYSNSATTIGIAEDIYVPNEIIRTTSGEHMLVTAINKTAHTITVIRGYQGTTAAAISSGELLFDVGSVTPEGGSPIDFKGTIAEAHWNYTQQISTTVEMTDRMMNLTLISGSPKKWSEEVKRGGALHADKIERMLFFGKRYLDTSNFGNRPATFTGGLFEFIQTNVRTDADGTLTRDEFEDWIVNQVLAYKNQFTRDKLVVVGGTIMKALNYWLDNKTTLNNPAVKSLGMKLKEYKTYRGDVMIYHSSFFDEIGYDGYALGLDINNIKITTFTPTKFRDNIQNPKDRVRLAEWYSDMGVKVLNEETHSILKGVTSYA